MPYRLAIALFKRQNELYTMSSENASTFLHFFNFFLSSIIAQVFPFYIKKTYDIIRILKSVEHENFRLRREKQKKE